MPGPYMVLMYGSNLYIFGINVLIKSVHIWNKCTDQIFLFKYKTIKIQYQKNFLYTLLFIIPFTWINHISESYNIF